MKYIFILKVLVRPKMSRPLISRYLNRQREIKSESLRDKDKERKRKRER
jgi:hypothetical protein